MLPKRLRVPLQSFPRNSKTVARTKNFTMKIAANNLQYDRGGVIVGKSSGGAAERNKIRRVIMDFFQKRLSQENGTGKDFVILVGPKVSESKTSILRKELESYGELF